MANETNNKNGIDSIYDPSDVNRILAQLRIRRIETEEDEAERSRNKARRLQAATKFGTSAYKMWSNQQAVETADLLKKGYERDPDIGFLKSMYTPAGGRVLAPDPEWIDPEAGGEFWNIDPSTGRTIGEGPKTLGESVSTQARGYGSSMAAKGSGLGGGVATALSAYDLARNWDKKSTTDKWLGGGKTALYAASMLPTPASPFLMAGATVLSLADMFID